MAPRGDPFFETQLKALKEWVSFDGADDTLLAHVLDGNGKDVSAAALAWLEGGYANENVLPAEHIDNVDGAVPSQKPSAFYSLFGSASTVSSSSNSSNSSKHPRPSEPAEAVQEPNEAHTSTDNPFVRAQLGAQLPAINSFVDLLVNGLKDRMEKLIVDLPKQVAKAPSRMTPSGPPRDALGTPT